MRAIGGATWAAAMGTVRGEGGGGAVQRLTGRPPGRRPPVIV